jgi:hypothetical protein
MVNNNSPKLKTFNTTSRQHVHQKKFVRQITSTAFEAYVLVTTRTAYQSTFEINAYLAPSAVGALIS